MASVIPGGGNGSGKVPDLSQVFRQIAADGGAGPMPQRRDRADSKYKSARKGRR